MDAIAQKSLYERLGGKKRIASLVDDIVDAHMENPVIKVRFLPYKKDPENLRKIKGHLVDFFSEGSGGDVTYKGRDMESTHEGMNISEAEYMAATDDIMNTLDRHGIDEQSKKDVLAIAYSLKDQIMKV